MRTVNELAGLSRETHVRSMEIRFDQGVDAQDRFLDGEIAKLKNRMSRTDAAEPTKPADLTPAELHALKERAFKSRCDAAGAAAGRALLADLEDKSEAYVKGRCESVIEADADMAKLHDIIAERKAKQAPRVDAEVEARARAWNEQAIRPEKWAEQSQKCADDRFGIWKPIAEED